MTRRTKWVSVIVAVVLVAPMAVWASDQFEDVPDSNVFHDDIGWLADSGVTFGCNPPENTRFCPSDFVTREQMAAFMRRLSEGEVVNAATANEADHATTADDAATLAGRPPTAYQAVTTGVQVTDFADSVGISTTSLVEVERLDMSLAAPSNVALTAHAYLERNSSGSQERYEFELRRDSCSGDQLGATFDRSAAPASGFYASTVTFTGFDTGVSGDVSYVLCVAKFDGSAPNATITKRGLIASGSPQH